MSRAVTQIPTRTVFDGYVKSLAGVDVEIRHATGGGLATVYAARAGAATIAQPLDSGPGGLLEVITDPGQFFARSPTGQFSDLPFDAIDPDGGAPPSGPAAITYDAGGNLSSYAGPGGDLDDLVYDAGGNLISFTEDGVARVLTYTDGNLTGVS